jgi:two-component system sensor histidine kinase DegS
MPTTEVAPVINPSALSGIRFLITQRIEDLDALATRLEARLADASTRRRELLDRSEENEVAWGHILKNLTRYNPDEVDNTFRVVSSTRADTAALEERFRDLGARLTDVRSEQEVLRSVFRSLDDLSGPVGAGTTQSAHLRDASRQVFQIIEEERMRIARDMHDGPAQSMANLVLQAEILERLMNRDPSTVAKELADFKDEVRGVLDETRRLIFDLRPMTLDDLGLVPTLRKFVKEFGEKSRIAAHLRVMGDDVRLPGAYEPTVFRIVQEALNNVRKHSQARTVEVIIQFDPSSVEATIRDDGVGFDIAATEARLESGKNLGIVSMRERVALEKGQITIRSQIGKGTEVHVSFDY